MKDAPMVTILIPMWNEEGYIARCLESIITNDYPQGKLEVLVIDGVSSDNSPRIVQEYASHHKCIRLMKNPKRIQAVAFNIGIQKARGEIILIMNAHSTYATDYIHQCVHALQTTGAANVSGVQRAVGTDYISNVIAVATTVPFGIGDARFRYSNREEWVDSVFPGAWYKKTLEELGGFDEDWVVNEDYELNYRLRKAGGKILLSPKIHCKYYVRGTLGRLSRQYFRYGFWKIKTLVAHPDSLRWRHIIPPAAIIVLVLSFIFIFIYWPGGLIFPIVYVLASLFASLRAVHRSSRRYLLLLPVVFSILHFCWGTGFFLGILKFGVPKISFRSLIQSFRT